ncbi:MAG: hypothetical protein R2822_19715 [Spirosomataceae bacterium]
MRYLIFAFLFIFISCQNANNTNAPKNYFDLKGFIETQIKELEKRKPLVNKKMALGDVTDTTSTTNINWAKELDLFIQADLNKQAYQLSYDIATPTAQICLYSLKPSEKLPVKLLKIELDEKTKQPILIEALFQEENQLYDSEKKLALTCTMRPEGVWLVKTYTISGFQHLALTDKKPFSIIGTIQ